MAGSTPASPTAERASRRAAPGAQPYSPGLRGLAALPPPPAGGREPVILLLMVLAVAVRAAASGGCRSTTSISPRSSQGPSLGASVRHRRSRPGPARAHALRRAHLARGRAWRRWWWRSWSACMVGAIAGMSRGGVDTALMWLTDLFLSLPQLPLLLLVIYLFRDALKTLFGPEVGVFMLIVVVIGGLRWMPVARLVRAQFLSLREKEFVEAARALGASKVAPGGAPHPAQCARAGDRRRHDRRRRRDHRRSRRCRSSASASRPTSRPGAASCSTPRTISTSRRIGRCFPAARSSSPCCPSTSSATACATRSIRARVM